MIRRPPRSTLFPSRRSSDLQNTLTLAGTMPSAVESEPGQGATWYAHELWSGQFRRTVTLPFEDRKSTRLNSSHANISYAVFCLKKRTSQEQAFDFFTQYCHS